MNESMENIEKLHQSAVRELRELKAAIESHTGAKLENIHIGGNDSLICSVEDINSSSAGKNYMHFTNSDQSVADMIGSVAQYTIQRHASESKLVRMCIDELDRNRAELVAKLAKLEGLQ